MGHERATPRVQRHLYVLVAALVAATLLLARIAFGAEAFVSPMPGGATVELRNESAVVGEAVLLKHICRWSGDDKGAMAPLADLTIARFGASSAFQSISLAQVKMVLHDAGANLGTIRFTGSTSCTVSRADVSFDEGQALRQWAEARQAGDATTRPITARIDAPEAGPAAARTLRDVLTADLAERLSLPIESLQVRFNAKDEGLLRLSEGLFKFNIESRNTRNLGDVLWNLTIVTDGAKQKAQIQAYARAWQEQIVVARPIASKQVIRSEDILQRRTLVDRLSDEPIATRDQILGQQAARELTAGTLVTPRMVAAVPLVRRGQLVSVLVESGHVQIKSVAEAREEGAYGQTIRVRKPGTTEDVNVVVTGPQATRATGR